MEFLEFKMMLQGHIADMLVEQTHLFITDVNKDELWNLYLDSFPEGTNNVYRERREYDCSCCRQFIRSFGNVVVLKDNKMISIWDFEIEDSTYKPVVNALSAFVKSKPIKDIFVTFEAAFGVDKNHEPLEDGTVRTWEHFYYKLPKRFVKKESKYSEAAIAGGLRDVRNVFKRSLDELSQDSIETVLELIAQKSLYKGDEWKSTLEKFLKIHKEYYKLPDEEKEMYCWTKSIEVGGALGKIRNHSIGTLLIDITEGVDLNLAVKKYEAIVAPSNYKRPKAIFTQKMIEQAQQEIMEMGLLDSLGRRYAKIDDITINNILFANRDAQKQMAGNSVFDELKKEVTIIPKNFDKVEEVTIEHFLEHVLPKTTNLEILLENKHASNFVSIIAPKIEDSPSMFKWNNGFSWSYAGNITDSMKERVKAAGGRVDGVLRFTHSWNELERNKSLMDLHVFLPTHNGHVDGKHDEYGNGERVGWNKRIHYKTNGSQDVDYVNEAPINFVPIENITFPDINKMPEGKYICKIHNWNFRNSGGKGKAEIEFDGNIYQYEYPKTEHKEWITVAEVTLKNGKFSIEHKLPESHASKTIWNVATNQFHQVSTLMFSPNYWDEQAGIGHKHYIFTMKDCKNDSNPNGFYNEFLKEELLKQKRVFEALGSKMRVEDSDEQLSGLGFSSTQRNSLICKVEGHTTRMIKLIF